MTSPTDNPLFALALLQAINDWQKSSSPKRGTTLKRLATSLPAKFQTCHLCCFRQIALDKGSVWDLLAENQLPEKISAWTTDLAIAKSFKGGVPPQGQGWQGVIFVLFPRPEHVVLNLSALYHDAAFNAAAKTHKSSIKYFADGIGRYGNSQSEVILEIPDLSVLDVHALGGFSSNRDELARLFFGKVPAAKELAWFDDALEKSGEQLGPAWTEGDSVNRIVKRMQPHVEALKTIKAVQEAEKKS
ncbi:MAG: hypothetical protein RIC85_03960 [Gammaproteobacteria bacterium]